MPSPWTASTVRRLEQEQWPAPRTTRSHETAAKRARMAREPLGEALLRGSLV